jgi:hypothetical protein
MAKIVGMLEAFGLAEQIGDKALTVEELLFIADARQRKGCRSFQSQLTAEERKRVMQLGRKCLKWKEQNR